MFRRKKKYLSDSESGTESDSDYESEPKPEPESEPKLEPESESESGSESGSGSESVCVPMIYQDVSNRSLRCTAFVDITVMFSDVSCLMLRKAFGSLKNSKAVPQRYPRYI